MKKVIKNIGLLTTGLFVVSSCTNDPDSPGIEYMPDMYRSPALEAYVDYAEIRNVEYKDKKVLLSSKTPPKYTIPFHSDLNKAEFNMPLPFKAHVDADETHNLYGYDMYETVDEFEAAFKGKIANYPNPIPYSEESFNQGKELYTQFCTTCHGDAGKGDGIVGKKIGGVANFTEGEPNKDTEGQLFYYITYGKGVMGAHGMLMSREERWKVVQYVKGLQNGGKYPSDAGLGINLEPDSTGVYQPSVLKNVYFVSGGSHMNMNRSKGTLNALVSFLRLNPGIQIEISGHTDSDGTEEINQPLSQNRAEAVKAYLVKFGGADASQIVAKGYGSVMPIASNDSAEGKQMNRRTEVVIVQ